MNKLLACVLVALCFLSTGCVATKGSDPLRIEQMDEAQFERMSDRVSLVTRAALGRLVREGDVDAQTVLRIADAVDSVLANPDFILAGSGLISKKLEAQGWAPEEVLVAVMLVEDFVRSYGGIGDVGLPIGTHGRALLHTISDALRRAAGGDVKPDEIERADDLLDAAGVKPAA